MEQYYVKLDAYGNFLKDGRYTSWHDNGAKMSFGNFKNGKEKGTHVRWYNTGQREQVATYKDGKPKECTQWFENGQIKSKRIYKNGKLYGKYAEWYQNGVIKRETTYKNNMLEGKDIWWFENAQKEKEINYKDDSLDGLQIYWYENGKKKQECSYRNGNLVGSNTEWDENGQIKDCWTDEEKKEVMNKLETGLKGSTCNKLAILECVTTVDGVDKFCMNKFLTMVAQTPPELLGGCKEEFKNDLEAFTEGRSKEECNQVIQLLAEQGYLK